MRDLRKVIGHYWKWLKEEERARALSAHLTPPIWAALHTPLSLCMLGSPLISMVTFTVSSQHAWTMRLNRNYLKALETYLEGKQKLTTPWVFTYYLKQLPIAFPGEAGDRLAFQAHVHSRCLFYMSPITLYSVYIINNVWFMFMDLESLLKVDLYILPEGRSKQRSWEIYL